MEIESQFKATLGRLIDNPTAPIVVAVSTGVDSMVLLTLLQRLPEIERTKLIVAHVNHELRAQSVAEETYLTDYCRTHQLKLVKTHWPKQSHPDNGIESAARTFRYQFFERVMADNQATSLMTAHHSDDNAETILMKLVRGGELTQLQGIAPKQPFGTGQLVRPLLDFNKAQLVAYAKANQIRWFEDGSNQINDVFRNRIRHDVIPLLKRENPAFLRHVAQYASQLTDAVQLADAQIEQLLTTVAVQHDPLVVSVPRFLKLSAVSQRGVVNAALSEAGVPINQRYLDEILQVLHNQTKPTAKLDLAQGFQLVKYRQQFSVTSARKVTENQVMTNQIVVLSNQWVQLSQGLSAQLSINHQTTFSDPWRMALYLTPEDLPLVVRPAQSQDRIRLASGGHKTVRRLLIDHHVSVVDRASRQVVVTNKGEVLWLIGIQRSARLSATTNPNYELVLKQTD